ncbi:MAG: hypothetical protein JWM74_3806, partial [Myxococcaceae bacterium]|nr:hypothetical protein [Myxococcaceae bacterium]
MKPSRGRAAHPDTIPDIARQGVGEAQVPLTQALILRPSPIALPS